MAAENGSPAVKYLSTDDAYSRFSSEKIDSRRRHMVGEVVHENTQSIRKRVSTEGSIISTLNEEKSYKLYPSRWVLLFIASSLNLSTSMASILKLYIFTLIIYKECLCESILYRSPVVPNECLVQVRLGKYSSLSGLHAGIPNWITFAAAADTSVEFYKISTLQLNLLSMCFVLVTIPFGLTAAWVTDTFGLRATFMIAAWSNGVGSLLRNISAMDIVPLGSKYSVVLIGQILVACGEKFVIMIPTKLAALWFPENRRALANMIAGMTDALGNMVAFIVVPLMVEVESDIPSMLWVMSAPAFLLALITTFCVKRSIPPTPPSASAAKISKAFFPGLKTLFKEKNYLILNLTFGAGFGVYISHLVLLEQSLCPRGYSDEFAGLCGALMIVTGTVFAALGSIYVDRTKKFDEVLKISFGLACLAVIAFTQVTRQRDQHIWVAVTSALFGGFALVIYPVSLELAVEVTFPVAAATSSGLCIITGSTQGIGIMFAMQFLARPLPNWERNLESGCLQDGAFNPQDFTYSYLWMSNCVVVTAFVILVLFFRPKYKRLMEERKVKAKTVVYIINTENIESSSIQITKL
ncbi:solute carrier family 49 member A3-like [Mercenaria mercenaria]|uniref:solute carrier family 49 member A3-like n=1 Tax=Mercenaria mercenaria TaxID=6596 RepID=UPI00234FA914|nr:solute carrier family 49 member A3-like [Mercenaria mercenaria]